MSVNLPASPYFICLSTTGLPLLMSYDQAAGLFFPTHYPIVSQQPFELHWLQGAKQPVTTKNQDIPSTGFKLMDPKYSNPQTVDRQKDSKVPPLIIKALVLGRTTNRTRIIGSWVGL